MVELAMVMTLGIVLLGIAVPKVSTAMSHTRVNKAAAVVAMDLKQATQLAIRTQKPIRLTYTASTQSYILSNRSTGASIRSRSLGSTTEYKLTTITFSQNPVDFFPSGLVSSALTVTLGSNNYSRQVTATTAGLVRVP
jgi:Tfp pilus assembly protein FimT